MAGLLNNSFVPAIMLGPSSNNYSDRIAPYVADPVAGKARLEAEIARLQSDPTNAVAMGTARDYGMMLQDVNARIARPDLGPLGPGTGGIDYGAQAEANAAKLHRKNARRQWGASRLPAANAFVGDEMNQKTPAAQTNLLPPAPLPPALPQVNGTITDAYRKPRGLLNPRI